MLGRGAKPLLISIAVLVTLFLLLGAFRDWTPKGVADKISQVQQSTSSGRTRRKAVIFGSKKNNYHHWLANLPSDWEHYRYAMDYDGPHFADKFGPAYHTPTTRGREGMVYLTFIIDHYDDLPDYMVFIHGHGYAWHQPTQILDKVNALNLSALDQDGYLNIRCYDDPICGALPPLDLSLGPFPYPDEGNHRWTSIRMLPAWYKIFFQEESHPKDAFPPTKFGAVGMGQFAVTADAVRSRPLRYWRSLRQPMITTKAIKDFDKALRDITIQMWGLPLPYRRKDVFGKPPNDTFDDWAYSALLERTWHKMFHKEDWYCKTAEYCATTYFGGAIQCPNWDETDALETAKCNVSEEAMAQIAKENDGL